MKINIPYLSIILIIIVILIIIFIPQEEVIDQVNFSEIPKKDIRIALIQHDSCPWSYFWCVVEQGILDAEKDLNVDVVLLRPNVEDEKPRVEQQKELIYKALDLQPKPTAIGITISADKDLFEGLNDDDEIKEKFSNKNGQSDTPVIVYNSNSGPNKENINYQFYIGQDDELAGYKAGIMLSEKLEKSGEVAKRGICINDSDAANAKDRCNGFKRALEEKNIKYSMLDEGKNISLKPKEIKKELEKHFQEHKDTNIYLSLGPVGAQPFYKFIEENKISNERFRHAIFDLSEIIICNIKKNNTLFAIDQQPYLQGYLTVQWLTWIKRHNFKLLSIGKEDKNIFNKTISTGPIFVDKSFLKENEKYIEKQVGLYR